MAHYALIDENNVIQNVITGVDEHVIQTDLDGSQVGGSSEAWEEFYASRPWFEGLTCKRTSYHAETNGFRKAFAEIGGVYDPIEDVFIPPKPDESWIFDRESWKWVAPVE